MFNLTPPLQLIVVKVLFTTQHFMTQTFLPLYLFHRSLSSAEKVFCANSLLFITPLRFILLLHYSLKTASWRTLYLITSENFQEFQTKLICDIQVNTFLNISIIKFDNIRMAFNACKLQQKIFLLFLFPGFFGHFSNLQKLAISRMFHLEKPGYWFQFSTSNNTISLFDH